MTNVMLQKSTLKNREKYQAAEVKNCFKISDFPRKILRWLNRFFFCLFFFLCVCFSDFYNLSFRSAYSKYKEKMRAKKNYCVDILCSRPVNIWWRRVKKIGFTMVSMMFHSFSFSIMGSSNWWHTFVFVHLVTVVRFVGIFVVWPFQANYEK